MHISLSIAVALVYFLLALACLRWRDARKTKVFAGLNLVFLCVAFTIGYGPAIHPRHLLYYCTIGLALLYAAGFVGHYHLLKAKRFRPAFWLPVLLLIAFKLIGVLIAANQVDPGFFKSMLPLLGLSYLTFKLSYSAVEVQNGKVRLPDFWTYMAYALYVPTLFVGPINPLSVQTGKAREAAYPLVFRLVLGLFKVTFLAAMLERLGYEALILNGQVPAAIDYPIAAVANYFYVYVNFSGACDMVIAGSRLLGIPVLENFNNPIMARSVQDFWTRWHMTLSLYFKEIVFTPFNMWLVSKTGHKYVNHCIAVTIMLVFLLIGLWHGTGVNFILFGLLHGLAVVINHYYVLAMKSWLGKRYKAFYHHPLTRGVAMLLTFCFISITMLLVNYDVAGFMRVLRFIAGRA